MFSSELRLPDIEAKSAIFCVNVASVIQGDSGGKRYNPARMHPRQMAGVWFPAKTYLLFQTVKLERISADFIIHT